ncbi:hypothetical protein ISR94_01650 [Candidatus Microgenomates bacterium]|nr:hypothetical protein [Candidatus Microgenomates bacterium]
MGLGKDSGDTTENATNKKKQIPVGPQLPKRTCVHQAVETGRMVRDFNIGHRPRVQANNTK